MSLYNFIGGKLSDSIPTLEKKINNKRKIIKTKDDKTILDQAEKILLDYHQRRKYDDDLKFYIPLISEEKFFNSSIKPMTSKNNGKIYVYKSDYKNINGKETKKEDIYVIENGKKKKLPLMFDKN